MILPMVLASGGVNIRTGSLTPGLTSSKLSHYHSLQRQTMLVGRIYSKSQLIRIRFDRRFYLV